MVSVLINNYNYGRYVGEAIESVLNQTYRDFELIVVDDGSGDDSVEIIKKYEREHPDKIKAVCKKNGGQASAFNAGFSASRGEIIAFLDSDDMWYPNKLETIVELHREYANVAHRKKISNGSREPDHYILWDKRGEILRKFGYFNNAGIITSVMSMKRELAEKIFPVPEKEFRLCADIYLYVMSVYLEEIYYDARELACYRIHQNNRWFGGMEKVAGSAENYGVSCNRGDRKVVEYVNRELEEKGMETIPSFEGETVRRYLRYLNSDFEVIPGGEYVLYGTGKRSERLKDLIQGLGGRIWCYGDSNPEKWGSYDGKTVYSLAELIEKRKSYNKIVIASTWVEDICQNLSRAGLEKGRDYMYICL